MSIEISSIVGDFRRGDIIMIGKRSHYVLGATVRKDAITYTMKPLSRWLIVQTIQILYLRIKFLLKNKKPEDIISYWWKIGRKITNHGE